MMQMAWKWIRWRKPFRHLIVIPISNLVELKARAKKVRRKKENAFLLMSCNRKQPVLPKALSLLQNLHCKQKVRLILPFPSHQLHVRRASCFFCFSNLQCLTQPIPFNALLSHAHRPLRSLVSPLAWSVMAITRRANVHFDSLALSTATYAGWRTSGAAEPVPTSAAKYRSER